jgi:hypothetical protein
VRFQFETNDGEIDLTNEAKCLLSYRLNKEYKWADEICLDMQRLVIYHNRNEHYHEDEKITEQLPESLLKY